jgi:hypothetical protein
MNPMHRGLSRIENHLLGLYRETQDPLEIWRDIDVAVMVAARFNPKEYSHLATGYDAPRLGDAERDMGLIRFRGHVPKGGYDVPTDGRHTQAPAAPAVH